MSTATLIPHLFRTEYRKLVSVLSKLFGIDHIAIAEDIASDTFLLASELWAVKGVPENPTAWLYTVAKNKTKDYLKRNTLFANKIAVNIQHAAAKSAEIDIDLSAQNIADSQLAMMFAICHPCISAEAQIALALNLLCGFGAEEIADAFLTNKEVIYKRLNRAKDKLRIEKISIEQPSLPDISDRLNTVLTTLYLLFNEGYYSTSKNAPLRREFCVEAMRLALLLTNNQQTNNPAVNALLSLMCFHSSRFDARTTANGEIILYENQDASLWNRELMNRGENYLNIASQGHTLSKYHVEAAIAYWHTHQTDSPEKWENILQLYNQLLQLEYSPMAALNRTYALAKANGKTQAIIEAEKLSLSGNQWYHSLLGNLYCGVDNYKALTHYEKAFQLAKSTSDKSALHQNIERLKRMIKPTHL